MKQEISREDRRLIQEYRNYDESKDQGGHIWTNLMARLAKRARSSDHMRIEEWVAEQEEQYNPDSSTTPSETRTENSDPIDSLDGRKYMEGVIARTADLKDKAFLERLLSYHIENKPNTTEPPSS